MSLVRDRKLKFGKYRIVGRCVKVRQTSMSIRVKVRVVNERSGASKELVVLVNGDAESEEPVIAVTPRDAGGKCLEDSLISGAGG